MLMEFDKNQIQFEFKNKFAQIYQNWCLLLYVKETQDRLETANHWSEELLTHIMSISDMKLIHGNKREKVYSAIKEMYFTKMEYNNEDLNIKCRLIKKFKDENLTYDLDHLQTKFKENIDSIMNMIAYSSVEEIETYCYSFWKI